MLDESVEWEACSLTNDILFHVDFDLFGAVLEHADVFVVLRHQERVLVASKFLDVALEERAMLFVQYLIYLCKGEAVVERKIF